MKPIDPADTDALPGRRLARHESFDFACHQDLACFNRCCRNLNLFLYPYDVLRLQQRLAIGAERFLDAYVDMVLRPGRHFPDVVLRMANDAERTCPFVAADGCTVYTDRPFTCRSFPLEKGLMMTPGGRRAEAVFFLRPPAFCLGPQQPNPTTASAWFQDADTATYDRMTERWARIQSHLLQDPWGAEGPGGQRAKMTFMAAYNVDGFRRFVFESSFLKRFKVPRERLRRIAREDRPLLELGLDWIELFVWGIGGKALRPK